MFASRIANTSAALLALALLVGCGKKPENKGAVEQSAQTPPATIAEAVSTAEAVPGTASAAASVTPPAAILASADGEQPGMRAEVRALRRDGAETVTLQFAVINDSDAEFSARTQLGATSHGNGDYETVSGVQLFDPVNKKKYSVVRDAENNCVCSTGVYAIAARSRLNLWAKFPALEDDVANLSVVIPHFMPMENVPIQ